MNLYDLDTPALIVDLDRLESNIMRMATLVNTAGKRLRPHTKTHKTPEIARMQQAAGACGLTVAKLGEAEVMVEAGHKDFFIANELVGEIKIARLMALLRRTSVIVGVDSLAVAEPIGEAAVRAALRVPVRIEVDTGLGRAGVRTAQEALALGIRLAEIPGLELDGLFIHEGQTYHGDDAMRAAECAAAASRLREAAEMLRATGLHVPDLSVGSTPGAPFMAREAGITEMRPGVYVFNDEMQVRAGVAAREECALTLLTTVVSRPDDTTVIVDAGTKSLSGDRAPDGGRHGAVMDNPGLIFDWANEEHGHLDASHVSLRPRVGDRLRIVPWHACACVNMHDTLYAVRDERVEATWSVAARGKIR